MDTKEQYQHLLTGLKSLEKSVERLFKELSNTRVESKYLNVREACKLLGISKSSLYRIMHSRELSFTSVGGSRKFLRTDLENFVQMNLSNTIHNVCDKL